MTAAYALAAGEWLPYIFGAPEFVNDAFVQQFREGLPPVTPRPVPGGHLRDHVSRGDIDRCVEVRRAVTDVVVRLAGRDVGLLRSVSI